MVATLRRSPGVVLPPVNHDFLPGSPMVCENSPMANDTRGGLEAQIRRLEEQLLDPEARRSAERMGELLADDFVEFASSGVTYDKERILEVLQDEALADDPVVRSLGHFEAIVLGPDVVLTRYHLLRRHPAHEHPTQSLRSSVWRRRDGRWQVTFHQGTYVARKQDRSDA